MCGLHPAGKGGTPILPGKGVMRAHVHAKGTDEHERDETDKRVYVVRETK